MFSILLVTFISVLTNAFYPFQDYGAVADCSTVCTDAIVAAIKAASNAGGGNVYFPPTPNSCFLSGAFNLTSNVVLELETGAVLRASDDASLYPCMLSVTWDTGTSQK